jgi:hypothetical protein
MSFNVSGGINTPGLYTLVEEKIFDSAATSFDFAATIDGNADKAYRMEFVIHNSSGSNAVYYIRYNATGRMFFSNRQYFKMASTTKSAVRTTTSAGIVFLSIKTLNSGACILTMPNTETGEIRALEFYDNRNFDSAGNIEALKASHGITTPTSSTNITGLGFDSTITDSIGIGSIARLYKLGS